MTSSVTRPFDSPYTISYWWSFGTKPLSVTVSEIFNVKCNAMVDTTSEQRSRSFILVTIDFLYNFCSRMHRLATIHNVTDDDRRNTVA